MQKNISVASLMFVSIGIIACNSNFTPKPKAYYKIDFPQRDYKLFNEVGYPYEFEYPTYATISREDDSTGNNPYWINVNFGRFNGKIYLSYKSIRGSSVYKVKTATGYRDLLVKNNFESLREEAYKLTYKHTVKASGIIDSMFVSGNGSSGVYFYVAGNAATSRQFYMSDTLKHFIRGSLYFEVVPNVDSLSIVSDFLDVDMRHLINTFKWKK